MEDTFQTWLVSLLNAPTALETPYCRWNQPSQFGWHQLNVRLFKLQLLLLMVVPSVWQVIQPFQSKQIQMTPQLFEALRNRTQSKMIQNLIPFAKFTIAVINTRCWSKPTTTSWKLATLHKMPLTLSWVSTLQTCVTTLTISHKHQLTLNFKNSLNAKIN